MDVPKLVLSLVWRLVQGLSNVLFWLHCVVKQNVREASYETLYKALNDWALDSAEEVWDSVVKYVDVL